MKQLHVEPQYVVEVELTGVSSLLKPTVFKEGNAYCCILGSNAHDGVFGCGKTPKAAVRAWDKELKKHLATKGPDDEVVQYVQNILKPPMSPDLQAIHDKYGLRPVDKSKTRF